MAMVASASASGRTWQRFTPAQRLSRFLVYLVIVAAIVMSIRTIEVIPEFLADRRSRSPIFLRGCGRSTSRAILQASMTR